MGNLILTIKDSKMRTVSAIVLIAMIASAMSAPSCQATDYCMGCHMTTANSCTSCFNWGSGKVGARSATTTNNLTNCITALPSALVTANCKTYSGAALSTATTKGSTNCSWCSKKYLTYTVTGTTEVCTDTATTGCTAVSNSEFTKCYVGTTTVAGVQLCSKGYYGTGTVNNAGYPTCTKASLANCDWAYDATTCIFCKSNYAVSSTGACAAFTTDSNCRVLHTDSTCSTCWNAYYWNVTTFKLGASLISAGALLLAAFFN